MKLSTKHVCNKDSIRKCDIPCVATSKHCDYVRRKFSQCVSVSGRIPGTERPIATKFRRQPRRKVLYMRLSTLMTHINITPYTKVATYWATKNENSAPRY